MPSILWPSLVALFDWNRGLPLAEQWTEVSRASEEDGERLLDCWIDAAERDEWTFDQLCRLLAKLRAVGEDVPTALREWAVDVVAGCRVRPSRPGPKGNREQDFELACESVARRLFDGESKRSIERDFSRRIHRTEDAVRAAIKRGFRVP